MIETPMLSVANLANGPLFTANCALIRKISSHFSFATVYAEASAHQNIYELGK